MSHAIQPLTRAPQGIVIAWTSKTRPIAGFPSDMVTLRIQADTASRGDCSVKVFCSKSEQPTAT